MPEMSSKLSPESNARVEALMCEYLGAVEEDPKVSKDLFLDRCESDEERQALNEMINMNSLLFGANDLKQDSAIFGEGAAMQDLLRRIEEEEPEN